MPEITAPNAQAYGTYEQALGQMLAGGGAVAGPLNALALNGYAREQRGQYGLALQRTQQMQQQAAQEANQVALQDRYMQTLASLNENGGARLLDPEQFNVNANMGAAASNDMSYLNNQDAEATKANSAALGNMYDQGQTLPQEAVYEFLTSGGVQNSEQQNFMPGYVSPSIAVDQQNANTRRYEAESGRINANRTRGGGGGSGMPKMSIRYVPDGFGGFEPSLTMSNASPDLVNSLMPGVIPGMGPAAPATNPFLGMPIGDIERQIRANAAKRAAERRE